jgi:SAM-dependent methyltransferase
MSDISSIIKSYKCEIAGNCHNLFLPDAVLHIAGEGEKRLYELEHLVDAQSVGFTTDLIPVFQGIIRQIQARLQPPFGTRYSVLDVGTRTGTGADLIARLFHEYMSIRLDVDVCDLDPTYKAYSDAFNSYIRNYFVEDAFELSQEYDFILASHTIEHVDDPAGFVKRLSGLSRYGAIFYCPVNEIDPIEGHRTITTEDVKSFGATKMWIVDSWWWRHVHAQRNNCPSKCVVFLVPGKENIGFEDISITYDEVEIGDTKPGSKRNVQSCSWKRNLARFWRSRKS